MFVPGPTRGESPLARPFTTLNAKIPNILLTQSVRLGQSVGEAGESAGGVRWRTVMILRLA
jgi:hypothetical protein